MNFRVAGCHALGQLCSELVHSPSSGAVWRFFHIPHKLKKLDFLLNQRFEILGPAVGVGKSHSTEVTLELNHPLTYLKLPSDDGSSRH